LDIELGGSLEKLTKINLNSYDFGFYGTGNVGIGTTDPDEKLHVEGVIKGYSFIDKQNEHYYINPADSTTSLLVNGSVGIGTTSPDYKLEVNGDTYSTNFYGPNGTPGSPIYSFFASPTTGIFRGFAINEIGFSNAGSTSMLINASGKVGIGTTNPSEKLHVNGNAQTSGWIGGEKIYTGSTGLGSGGNGPSGTYYGSYELNFSNDTGTKINLLDGFNKQIQVPSSSLLRILNHESGATNQYIEILADTGSNSRIDLGSFNDSGNIVTL